MAYKLRGKAIADEPVMSDLTILVSVEDLINIAMGPCEENTINFKMIQTVLHILARQMRLLETKVDLKIAEVGDLRRKKKKRSHSSDSPSSDTSPKRERMEEIEEEKDTVGKKKDKASKEKADKEKRKKKDKSDKDYDEDEEKAEREKMDKMSPKEREKYMKEKEKRKKQSNEDEDESESRESSQKREKNIKEKEKRVMEKMSPEEKQSYIKQKEKEEKVMKTMSTIDKEKYLKEKERELNEMQQMSSKEKEKHLKDKEQELNALQEMSPAEREKHFDSKAELKTSKGKEKSEEKKEIEQKSSKSKEKVEASQHEIKLLEKMTPKEKELYAKQKERDEQFVQKMSPNEKEKYFQEKEKEDKAMETMSPKERDKYLQDKEVEAKSVEKMSPKQKEKYLTEKKSKMMAQATGSGTSIAITEVERQNEKILIVEKGPTTRGSSKTRVGSIEVVTVSQFNILEAEVQALKKTAAPLPIPALPDNKKLKSDLVKGSASLTDTMQAMQVSARVQAAEAGLARMAGLLTQLAASGALPDSFAGQLENAKAEMDVLRSDVKVEARAPSKSTAAAAQGFRKSVAIDALSIKPERVSQVGMGASTTGTRPSSAGMDKRASVMSAVSRHSRASVGRPLAVTRNEMDDAIQSMREDMTKSMQAMTYRAASSAESAAGTAKGIADKMDVALKLNTRISDLYALTTDYAEQLSGFDAGLSTQMQSFQEQMIQMREDLKTGLVQLEAANNNAETAAVLELTERYDELQNELEGILVEHHRLTAFQTQLEDELRGLVEAVETLKEQKADRDEVWDGLRDKADLTRLAGLLTEEEFALSRHELDSRLDVCYSKFNKQEAVWMGAMKDLTDIAMDKAEIMQLLSVRDDAQDYLRVMQEQLRLMIIQLGEPKAAILTRLLSKDGTCAACKVPALMDATSKRAMVPPALPALRPPPDGQPCMPELVSVVVEDDDVKSHICNRWVGGSHTLMSRSVTREAAAAQIAPPMPVKKYTGYGVDGKLYNLEEELLPCIECNKLTKDVDNEETGAGDTAPKVCECWPGVQDVLLIDHSKVDQNSQYF